jgi:NADH:ubiquinone oxidoreductase subunit 3 (subunit A)
MKQQKSMLISIAVIAAVVVTITLVMTTVATLIVPAAHASGSGVHYHLFNSGKTSLGSSGNYNLFINGGQASLVPNQ